MGNGQGTLGDIPSEKSAQETSNLALKLATLKKAYEDRVRASITPIHAVDVFNLFRPSL